MCNGKRRIFKFINIYELRANNSIFIWSWFLQQCNHISLLLSLRSYSAFTKAVLSLLPLFLPHRRIKSHTILIECDLLALRCFRFFFWRVLCILCRLRPIEIHLPDETHSHCVCLCHCNQYVELEYMNSDCFNFVAFRQLGTMISLQGKDPLILIYRKWKVYFYSLLLLLLGIFLTLKVPHSENLKSV